MTTNKIFKCFYQDKLLELTFSGRTPKMAALKAISFIFSKNSDSEQITFKIININNENEYYDLLGRLDLFV